MFGQRGSYAAARPTPAATAGAAIRPAEAPAARRLAGAGALGIFLIEVLGAFIMWLPNPVAWLWVGARTYDATQRISLGGLAALIGILISTTLLMMILTRLDMRWVVLRRRAGREQKDGALTQVVVVSATLALAAFYVWQVMNQAFIMPFMPMN
jgi:hypothetical protein